MCSRWVPKMLTDIYKTKSPGSALTFLTRYRVKGDEFSDSIVTGDETLVCHVTADSKQQSMEWRHSQSAKSLICFGFNTVSIINPLKSR
ncbi:hypothetical protein Trydic_g5455 [Trypoxylus dichotomus]